MEIKEDILAKYKNRWYWISNNLNNFFKSGILFQYTKIQRLEKIDDELEDFVCHKWSLYNMRKHLIYGAIILLAVLVCIGLDSTLNLTINLTLNVNLKLTLNVNQSRHERSRHRPDMGWRNVHSAGK